MGCNSNTYLPNDVHAEDVVIAIAYLCGATRKYMSLGGGCGSYAWIDHAEVRTEPEKKAKYVYITPTTNMQYFIIHIAPTDCDEQWHEGSLFLYPNYQHKNTICLYAGVSEFWQKIAIALIDLFGGYADFDDCDAKDVDYRKAKPRKCNCAGDGKDWQEIQDALLNLPVLFHFLPKKV